MTDKYCLSEGVTLYRGDCLHVMSGMSSDSVDAIVTDPPYGLGFMGKAWDDLPPGLEWAQECLRVLKPGGHILAFGGTRTWHRLAVSIEDAGFEIRDSLAWMHGQGFPKGGSQLKPAFEPVVMGRKPFVGSMTANIARHGTGSLQIDAARLPATGRWPANVILDTHMAAVLDMQSGTTKSVSSNRGVRHGSIYGGGKGPSGPDSVRGHNDSGGASRFFYTAKASGKERPKVDGIAHPTVKPLALMRWLIRLVTPPGGLILDPFAGSGTTLKAARLEGFRSIGIEREADYLPLILARILPKDGAQWNGAPDDHEYGGEPLDETDDMECCVCGHFVDDHGTAQDGCADCSCGLTGGAI